MHIGVIAAILALAEPHIVLPTKSLAEPLAEPHIVLPAEPHIGIQKGGPIEDPVGGQTGIQRGGQKGGHRHAVNRDAAAHDRSSPMAAPKNAAQKNTPKENIPQKNIPPKNIPAPQATPYEKLRRVEEKRDEAARRLADLDRQAHARREQSRHIARRLRQISAKIQEHARVRDEHQDQIRQLGAEMTRRHHMRLHHLDIHGRAFARLYRIRSHPPLARRFSAMPRTTWRHGSFLLDAIARDAGRMVRSLLDQNRRLLALRGHHRKIVDAAAARQHRQRRDHRQFTDLLAQRRRQHRDLEQAIGDTQKDIAELQRRHRDLRALIDALTVKSGAARPDAMPDLSEQKAHPPAAGRMKLVTFGQTTALRIVTRPAAHIIAPFAGRIIYAGIFRSYGMIVIIDHGKGYHSVMTGLDRVSVFVGQDVIAGEPIAAMATEPVAGTKGHLVLHLEIRRNGHPIRPDTWFPNARRQG